MCTPPQQHGKAARENEVGHNRGLGEKKVGPRLRNFLSQIELGVVSNTKEKNELNLVPNI